MTLHKLRPSYLRAALWAGRALRSVRRDLRSKPLAEVQAPSVPLAEGLAENGVKAILRVNKASCLERAILWQAWNSAKGQERDLVIGVTAPVGGFRAHAWLEGDPPCHTEDFTEITRRPARA